MRQCGIVGHRGCGVNCPKVCRVGHVATIEYVGWGIGESEYEEHRHPGDSILGHSGKCEEYVRWGTETVSYMYNEVLIGIWKLRQSHLCNTRWNVHVAGRGRSEMCYMSLQLAGD